VADDLSDTLSGTCLSIQKYYE